jgi:ribosome-associated heat shock protein Hsp15
MEASVRIDKFIWAVRFYKTRSIAAEAVKSEQVMLNGAFAKPAATVKPGDEIRIKRNPIWRSYRIKTMLKNRVAAKLLPEFIEDITPAEEIEKLEMMKLMPGYDRERGTGRPTKKERRELDDFGW